MKKLIIKILPVLFLFESLIWYLNRKKTYNVFYHGITPDYDPDFKTVAVKDFERQIKYFKKHFEIMPLGEERSHRKPALTISFDDGYMNNLTYALPILEKYQVPATVFCLGISTTKEPYIELRDKPHLLTNIQSWQLLNRDALIELSKSPFITIGSHGYFHEALTGKSASMLSDDILKAKSVLEGTVGYPVNILAFPYGLHDMFVVKFALYCGYRYLYGVKDPCKGVRPRHGISGKSTFHVNMINLWRSNR